MWRSIQGGFKKRWQLKPSTGLYHEVMTLPVEHKRISRLIAMTARALLWFANGHVLSETEGVEAKWLLDGVPVAIFQDLLRSGGKRHHRALSSGLCEYQGVISEEESSVSAWVFDLFGGITLSDSSLGRQFNFIGVMTGPSVIFRNKKPGAENAPAA
jgi:hypothetical protein